MVGTVATVREAGDEKYDREFGGDLGRAIGRILGRDLGSEMCVRRRWERWRRVRAKERWDWEAWWREVKRAVGAKGDDTG